MKDAIKEKWVDQLAFWRGYEDGKVCAAFTEHEGVEGQAYDRGYQCGMEANREGEDRRPHWFEPTWADDPNIGKN